LRITIIGWYGTETIGDRAILTGLISTFNNAYDYYEIKLGSLYPFFSDRTVCEDYGLWNNMIGKNIKISLFDSTVSSELKKAILYSDLVVMGGGPLMDIGQMFMVEYAFKMAKSFNKKTAILGCGVGPLFAKKYQKSLINIVNNSDLVVFRDSVSKKTFLDLAYDLKRDINSKIVTSTDPAVECVLQFKAMPKAKSSFSNSGMGSLVINLRKFPSNYSAKPIEKNVNLTLKGLVENICERFSEKEILLLPMHYFHVGDDDRVFLNEIKFAVSKQNLSVQNKPLTLEETMQKYQGASINIGMRFHAILMQTLLSLNNYALDYTEPKKGKIYGYLTDVMDSGFISKYYVSLQQETENLDRFEATIKNEGISRSKPDAKQLKSILKVYTNELKCFSGE